MTTAPISGVASTSGLPYTFNPPIHPSLQHVFPNAGLDTEASYSDVMRQIYDESKSVYGDTASFKELRLGRIVMGKDAMSFALKQAGTRYGFRFLYNPGALSGGTNVGTDFIADPSNTVTAVLQEGLESIAFQLMLNRVPEVMGKPSLNEYTPPMTDRDMGEIKLRGTHYDLEFLHRVANGIHNTTVRSGTGDIGILLPNPCELFLGPMRSRGALDSIQSRDIMFSPDMVPMLTNVSITFSRFLTITNEGIISDGAGSPISTGVPVVRLKAAEGTSSFFELLTKGLFGGLGNIADWVTGAGSTGTAVGSGGAAPAPPTSASGKLTGAQVYELARGAGFSSTADASLMTKISYYESGWNPRAHNPNRATGDNSYGLWQINMIDTLGPSRRKQFGIATNEELFDPRTNAKAAYMIYKGQGFKAWTTLSKARASSITW